MFREELWIVARRKAVGDVNLAAVEHHVEGLRRGQPGERDAGRRGGVRAEQPTVAQVTGSADVPRKISSRRMP